MQEFAEKYPQIILEKNVLNVFSNPNTLPLLEAIFPDKVYVYGVVTEFCVKEAVDNLLKENFEVIIIEDAVKEISEKEKEALFAHWRKKGVKFFTTEKIIKSLANLD